MDNRKISASDDDRQEPIVDQTIPAGWPPVPGQHWDARSAVRPSGVIRWVAVDIDGQTVMRSDLESVEVTPEQVLADATRHGWTLTLTQPPSGVPASPPEGDASPSGDAVADLQRRIAAAVGQLGPGPGAKVTIDLESGIVVSSGPAVPEETTDAQLVAGAGARPPAVDSPPTVGGGAGAGGDGEPRSHPTDERAQMIADLRQLLDYLDAHPELPVGRYDFHLTHSIGVWVDGGYDAEMAELDRIRQAVGEDAADLSKWDTGSHPAVSVRRGHARFRWYVVPPKAPAELPPCGPVPTGSCAGTKLTPTRRRLLDSVERGDVIAEAGQAHDRITGRRETAQIITAITAGWVVEGPQDPPGTQRRRYVLTDAGRAEAAAYDRARGGTA